MVFSPFVVHLFAGNSAAGDQAVELNRIVFPYLFFVAMAALAMGILNCFHMFGLPAATPVVLNIATIAFSIGAVWKYFKDPATSIVVGVLVGGVLQFLIQVPALVKKGMTFKFGISFSHPAIKNVARLMIPRLFGIGIGQINLQPPRGCQAGVLRLCILRIASWNWFWVDTLSR
jgi:putative peptidoglycan lipid II flippase